MRADWLHPATLRQATHVQHEIAAACITDDRFAGLDTVAGADTSMKWRDSRGPIHAAIAPVGAPAVTVTAIPPFAYVPGYLGFREAPALVAAWALLARKPDLLFVDGHGRAHPRRCGIATHLGVLLDWPTIGVAKSLLCGRVEGDLPDLPGATAPLVDRDELVGIAVRTRAARCRSMSASATASRSRPRSRRCCAGPRAAACRCRSGWRMMRRTRRGSPGSPDRKKGRLARDEVR